MRIKREIEDRKGILGMSGLAAAIGLSTFKTPYDAYLDYTGQKKEPTPEEQELFDMGHALEGFTAKQAEPKYGVKMRESHYAYTDPAHPKLICHPDRLIVGKIGGERVAVEIKSNTAFDKRWGQEDTDQVPITYLVQCYGYFACKVPCDVVWLIRFSNNHLYRYIIRPNEEIQNELVQKGEEFCKKVDAGWVPEPTNYKEATEIFTDPVKDSVEADDETMQKITRLSEIKSEMKALSAEEDRLKTSLVSYMNGKEVLSFGGEVLMTYKKIFQYRFDAKRFEQEHPDLYSQYLKDTSYMRLA